MSIIAEALPKLAEMTGLGVNLTIYEAAKIAGVKPRTVRGWIFAGKGNAYLGAYRIGSRLRVTAGSLLRFLEATAVTDRNRLIGRHDG